MISKEFLKTNLKYLNGFIPVYKPPGMCSHRLSEGLKLDLYFVFEHCGMSFGKVHVNHARDLEPFAGGLMTFILGYSKRRRKNFALADYTYTAEIEFGVQRQFNTIEGRILAKSSTKDITETRIRDALPNFIGEIEQFRCKAYRNNSPFDESIRLSRNIEPNAVSPHVYIDHYNQIILAPKPEKREKQEQKYPHHLPPRTYLVRDIKLNSYKEPYAEFTISCRGGFLIRKFAADLADRLGTHASVSKLTRLQEGPMCLDDPRVLHPYEVNLEYYIHRLKNLSKLYSDFEAEIEPLWEDIST